MNKYSPLCIVAIIMLSSIGLVTAQDDVKCVWEPCGTKVMQADIDAVYDLVKDEQIRIVFGDANSDGIYQSTETVYVDMVQNGNWLVEAGDVRLSPYHGTPGNTKVDSNEERTETAAFVTGQMVIGFVDLNGNGLDLGDPVYVDTDGDSEVSVGDVRLTERKVNTQTYQPYTVVSTNDWDITDDLQDMVAPYGTNIITNFNELVGYIDSDCSGDWTCVDKLYLQQLWRNRDICNNWGSIEVADDTVTIGDIRLYIPDDAVANEGWPPCGTKVKQGDVDATYVLVDDCDIRIMFGDANSNGIYDSAEETIYVDMVNNGIEFVQAGDVRLSPYHGTPGNTKVQSNEERNEILELRGGQYVIGYVDVNHAPGKYDLGDPLYIDADNNQRVSTGDVRLTARVAMGTTYAPFTVVRTDDFDRILAELLYDPIDNSRSLNHEAYEFIGYIDSDCSGDWTCVDKLYLQQIVTGGSSVANAVSSIGDLRLYIPQEAIADGWPVCGTKVEQCDVDAVYVLMKDQGEGIRIVFGDADSDGVYDKGEEAVYVDMFYNGMELIQAGDVRLSPYHEIPGNTKVQSNEERNEIGILPGGQAVIGFVEMGTNNRYDLADPVYVDTDGNSRVTAGDVRLTMRKIGTNEYAAYTVVNTGDWDLLGDTVLRDIVTGSSGLQTPAVVLLGYIDSDCSGDWTCVDKLYLQQIKASWQTDGIIRSTADELVTIGDLRLYIPPEETGGQEPGDLPCDIYDTNGVPGIQKAEAVQAIKDYLIHGTIEKSTAVEVLKCYFGI